MRFNLATLMVLMQPNMIVYEPHATCLACAISAKRVLIIEDTCNTGVIILLLAQYHIHPYFMKSPASQNMHPLWQQSSNQMNIATMYIYEYTCVKVTGITTTHRSSHEGLPLNQGSLKAKIDLACSNQNHFYETVLSWRYNIYMNR